MQRSLFLGEIYLLASEAFIRNSDGVRSALCVFRALENARQMKKVAKKGQSNLHADFLLARIYSRLAQVLRMSGNLAAKCSAEARSDMHIKKLPSCRDCKYAGMHRMHVCCPGFRNGVKLPSHSGSGTVNDNDQNSRPHWCTHVFN